MNDSAYEVKLGLFEGPLDLLLYLVQKHELDPKDISISEITDQYLSYIDDIEKTDLSLAGDFLLMASRLMSLKARELLPRDEQGELDQMEFDEDREALIQQMLEYQKFKEASRTLKSLEEENYGAFYRGRLERARKQDEKGDLAADAGIYQLFKAFQQSLKHRAAENVHTIELDDVTIEDRQQNIENYLLHHGRAMFEDLLQHDRRRITAAVTFMALLEMVKLDQLVIRQSDMDGVIWVYRKKSNTQFTDEMSRDQMHSSKSPDFKQGLSTMLRQRTDSRADVWEGTLDNVLREVTRRVADGKLVSEKELSDLLCEGQDALEDISQMKIEVDAQSASKNIFSEYLEIQLELKNAVNQLGIPEQALEQDIEFPAQQRFIIGKRFK